MKHTIELMVRFVVQVDCPKRMELGELGINITDEKNGISAFNLNDGETLHTKLIEYETLESAGID